MAFKDIDDIEMMNIANFGEPNYWLSTATIKKESKASAKSQPANFKSPFPLTVSSA